MIKYYMTCLCCVCGSLYTYIYTFMYLCVWVSTCIDTHIMGKIVCVCVCNSDYGVLVLYVAQRWATYIMQGPRFFHQRYWGPHRTMHFKTRCITKIPFQMWQNTCPSPQIAKITGMPTDMLWENWGFCCWCCCKNSKDYSKHAYKQQHKTGVGQKQTKTTTTTTIQYQKKTVDAKLLLCIGPL